MSPTCFPDEKLGARHKSNTLIRWLTPSRYCSFYVAAKMSDIEHVNPIM